MKGADKSAVSFQKQQPDLCPLCELGETIYLREGGLFSLPLSLHKGQGKRLIRTGLTLSQRTSKLSAGDRGLDRQVSILHSQPVINDTDRITADPRWLLLKSKILFIISSLVNSALYITHKDTVEIQ